MNPTETTKKRFAHDCLAICLDSAKNNKMISLTLLSLIVGCVLLCGNANADSSTNPRDALVTSLRAQASPWAPPPDLPVNMKVDLKLISIHSLCPKIYIAKAHIYQIITWFDSRLSWSLSDFNASYVVMAETDIWKPDLAVWQKYVLNFSS